ncbi:uncharacterized protein BDR25DRAFT_351394 [Lindgomyces ingoldianus]|uniref:Uncharacterized protein n=1 Tax=Lindgomyces ingoldianus TaxID=673940 RepID=A0ACB6R9A7_9PLEO|nr:uncharacterized protein BDR25DRAFT_351394 [Lindgomyces ingoldianus]KAF2474907.1 hypothetical protein BDR25DRAFT_351394 [Lindgomyces ingoldianus]
MNPEIPSKPALPPLAAPSPARASRFTGTTPRAVVVQILYHLCHNAFFPCRTSRAKLELWVWRVWEHGLEAVGAATNTRKLPLLPTDTAAAYLNPHNQERIYVKGCQRDVRIELRAYASPYDQYLRHFTITVNTTEPEGRASVSMICRNGSGVLLLHTDANTDATGLFIGLLEPWQHFATNTSFPLQVTRCSEVMIKFRLDKVCTIRVSNEYSPSHHITFVDMISREILGCHSMCLSVSKVFACSKMKGKDGGRVVASPSALDYPTIPMNLSALPWALIFSSFLHTFLPLTIVRDATFLSNLYSPLSKLNPDCARHHHTKIRPDSAQ